MEGLEWVVGESEYLRYGMEREQMAACLSAGAAAAVVIGSVSGIFADLM